VRHAVHLVEPHNWNQADIGLWDGTNIDPIGPQALAEASVVVDRFPNVYAPDEPVPFVATVFLEVDHLNQRNFNSGESIFNEHAPRGQYPPTQKWVGDAGGQWDWIPSTKVPAPWIFPQFSDIEEPPLPTSPPPIYGGTGVAVS
jgi:hypothetical protein